MRKPLTLLASAALRRRCGRRSHSAHAVPSEDIVVTATREARDSLTSPASVSRIDGDDLARLGAKHQADALNRAAGVYIQRGSGAESLGAIRSPVLTGAGACGAFLSPRTTCRSARRVLQSQRDVRAQLRAGPSHRGAARSRAPRCSAPARSTASSMSSLRTPATCPASSPVSRAGRIPSNACGSASRTTSTAGTWAPTASRRVRRAGATPRESTRPRSTCSADHEVGDGKLRLRAAGTVLNQETAGFIQGFDAYRDDAIARSNPNPEAFRDASSARIAAHYDRESCFGRDCRLQFDGIYRRSRMDFLQHFLIGKPLEHNAQTSYMASGTLRLGFLESRLEARLDRRRRNGRHRAHANSSRAPRLTARPRRMPSVPPAFTTTTPSTRTRSAPPLRSTTISPNPGRSRPRCAPIALTTTTTIA